MLEDYAATFRFFQTEAKTITQPDKSSSYFNDGSKSTQMKVPDADVPLPSPTTDFGLIFDDVDLNTANEWTTESQSRHDIRSFYAQESPYEIIDSSSFKEEMSATPDVSSAFPNSADFASPFSTTPINDSSGFCSKFDPAPCFLSLFDAYLEAHKAVVEISSGLQDVSIEDLKDGSRIMNTLRTVGDLGNTIANSPSLAVPSLQGLVDQGCLLFAFTAVLKACDLVEHVLKRVLPANHPTHDVSLANHSIHLGFHESVPPCSKRPRFMDTYPMEVYLPGTSQHPKQLAERITTLIRLDLQLSHLNQFISRFIDLTRGQGLSAHGSIPQCQVRLLNFHTRVSAVIESMTPSWDCEVL